METRRTSRDERSSLSLIEDSGSFTVDDDDALRQSRQLSFVARSSFSTDDNSLLAQRETSTVTRLRRVVFGALFLSMVVVAALVYMYTSRAETDNFESQFREDSDKVLQSLGVSLDLTLGALDALVVNIVSHTQDTGQEWPFVVIPNFAARAEKTRGLTHALLINIYTYVTFDQRAKWENFTSIHGPSWVLDTLHFQASSDKYDGLMVDNMTFINVIYDWDEYEKPEEEWGTVGLDRSDPGPFMPYWQTAPVISADAPYNWDLMSVVENKTIVSLLDTHKVTLSEAYLISYPNDTAKIEENEAEAEWYSGYITTDEDPMEPMSDIYYPILDISTQSLGREESYDPAEQELLGILSMPLYWRDLIKGILPEGSNGIVVVVSNECNPTFSYQIDGPNVIFLGVGDHHERKYNNLVKSSNLLDLEQFSFRSSGYTGIPVNELICPYRIRVYPSSVMEDDYTTNNPVILAIVTVLVFGLTSATFLLYDLFVEKRQKRILSTAVQSTAIVSSLFPRSVQDRLFPSEKPRKLRKETARLKKVTDIASDQSLELEPATGSLPIADQFENTTVFFCDIVGFTSWSASREPYQVFLLLETVYGAFDKIAKRRGVFKVETIGDSYVAVTGLPEPRKDHAAVMVRFAAESREAMKKATRKLANELGPGTEALCMRFGLHSGSVTAGVLRGDKARFQLFGDTVNTASRMESSGVANRIHVSPETAGLLRAGGYAAWIEERATKVQLKGKGLMQTFWAEPRRKRLSLLRISMSSNSTPLVKEESSEGSIEGLCGLETTEELIDWNVGVFTDVLLKILAVRGLTGEEQVDPVDLKEWFQRDEYDAPRDVMADSVQFQASDNLKLNVESVSLPPAAETQLRDLISILAHSYRDDHRCFHCFDHASQVVMSTMSFIQQTTKTSRNKESHKDILDIASDPLAQLAVMMAALIHDVDHPGVSNMQLIKEESSLATRYKNKSVAEQNAVDIAWNLFLEPHYKDLHACMFKNSEDLHRFYQLLVNCVMATDIFDSDLKDMREKRWEGVFSESAVGNDPDVVNRKTTILLEHLTLVSDVYHTMQPWNTYREWNNRLFSEESTAYKNGRATANPAQRWYLEELLFFDNYVIPLASKMADCGIFGALGKECLDNAIANRQEWEHKGRDLVAELLEFVDSHAEKDEGQDGRNLPQM